MSNSLTKRQDYLLNKWLADGNAGTLSRLLAAEKAKTDLGFPVTYTNMRSAEEVTGISLVKPPKAKEADADLAARIYELERSGRERDQLMFQFAEHIKYKIPQKLVDAYMRREV